MKYFPFIVLAFTFYRFVTFKNYLHCSLITSNTEQLIDFDENGELKRKISNSDRNTDNFFQNSLPFLLCFVIR